MQVNIKKEYLLANDYSPLHFIFFLSRLHILHDLKTKCGLYVGNKHCVVYYMIFSHGRGHFEILSVLETQVMCYLCNNLVFSGRDVLIRHWSLLPVFSMTFFILRSSPPSLCRLSPLDSYCLASLSFGFRPPMAKPFLFSLFLFNRAISCPDQYPLSAFAFSSSVKKYYEITALVLCQSGHQCAHMLYNNLSKPLYWTWMISSTAYSDTAYCRYSWLHYS